MSKRRGGYYESWYPEPSRPLPAAGIQAKGTFGESWWARRWIKVLESLGLGTRLSRGRSYARQGQVLSIDLQPGLVKAKVQGSRPTPYTIKIALPLLTAAQWERASDAMAEQAIFAAQLLAGEMPQDIETAFQAAGVPLFPQSAHELTTACSCPDWENPCKHIAAVYYLLSERFDADPFLIFQLRGRSQEQISAALRARRAAATPEEEAAPTPAEPAAPLGELLAGYYEAGPELETLGAHIRPPDVDGAVLKRLGAPPANTELDLRVLYSALSRWVQDKVFGEERDSGA